MRICMALTKISQTFGGYIATRMAKAITPDLLKMENPHLLVILPASIVIGNLIPSSAPAALKDHYRKELDKQCTDAVLFDQLTIVPVNNELDKRGIQLTKESFNAIKADIDHSKQMSMMDPVYKKIFDYQQQPYLQKSIAISFAHAGEHEGALLHKGLAASFQLRASLYQYAIAPIENIIRLTLGTGNEE